MTTSTDDVPQDGPGLHTTRVGDTGSWVVFCHGLFGQGKNWTGVAKALATAPDGGLGHRSLLVDLPQHGRSPWADEVSYLDMAERLADTLGDLDEGPVALVGHSMGAKVAMLLALRRPDLVERLCVVDMSPVEYGGAVEGGFTPYVQAMRAVDLARLERRSDADAQLADEVPDPVVRGFLLQNLRRVDARDRDVDPASGAWRWQMNLAALGDHLDVLGGWPETAVAGLPAYDGAVLWVAGQHSDYIRAEYHAAMAALFPRVQRVTVKGAGHWVHSEQPEVFVEVLRRFLAAGGAGPSIEAQPRG